MPNENDGNGNSHWIRNIAIIIIIALLIWQFGIPFLNNDIKIPSDYINDLMNPDASNSEYSMYIVNRQTAVKNEYFGFQYYEKYMLSGETFSLCINSNIPGSISGLYTWSLTVSIWNASISDWSLPIPLTFKIPGYQAFYKHNWVVPDDNLRITYEYSYSIHMVLTDFNGNPIESTSGFTEQVIRLNSPINTPP